MQRADKNGVQNFGHEETPYGCKYIRHLSIS
jgi:hypothetical protein